jgi:hypothetical protein
LAGWHTKGKLKMTSSLLPSTYEKIIPFKKIPYWLMYLLLGGLFFVFSGLALTHYGENLFLAIRVFITFAIGVIPSLLIQFSKVFITRMKELSALLWTDKSEFETWLERKNAQIFTLKTKQSKITSYGILIAVILTILFLGLPLKNQTLGIIALIGFTPTVFILGQSAYVCAELFFTLAELAKRPVQVPFFKLPHPTINGLYSDYSLLAILLTVGYALLFWAAWDSPYGLSVAILVWLIILAIYPVAMFFWSIVQVHILMQRIKQSHLEIINQQIQYELQKITDSQEASAYDQLTKAIDIQNKVQNLPEWPISLSGTITFFITTATAVIQITLSVLQVFNP